MSEDRKQQLLNKLASCSLLLGAVAVTGPSAADAAVIEGGQMIGSGAQVRAELLGVTLGSAVGELRGAEGSCGEGKCGEASCGDDKDGDEGSCGDGGADE